MPHDRNCSEVFQSATEPQSFAFFRFISFELSITSSNRVAPSLLLVLLFLSTSPGDGWKTHITNGCAVPTSQSCLRVNAEAYPGSGSFHTLYR